MKYIEALKKYNEGSDKWCMPRKNSEDYLKIMKIMKKISNIKKSSSKYSHSFGSKSSINYEPRTKDYQILDHTPDIYLINAVGDGDCFINAIFDYGLYTCTLELIYNRLLHIESLILSKSAKYGEGIEKVKELFKGFSLMSLQEYIKKYNYNNNKNEYLKIVRRSLFQKENIKVPSKYSKLSKNLKYFTHRRKIDRGEEYDKERKMFTKSMKYIQVLYIYTFGKNIFLNRLNRYMDIAISTEGLEVLDWDHTLINYVKDKYYKQNGDLKSSIDINILLDEYMKIYAETKGYFTGNDQIFIFKIIFFKKIRIKGADDTIIPRIWLNNETIISLNKSIKVFKFLKKVQNKNSEKYKFIEKDNSKYIYISLLRDGEHYLLFVAKTQTKIHEFPKILNNSR